MQTLNFATLQHGDTFEMEGLTFRVTIERDDNMGAPWENSDCHGPVSKWTTRDKLPGERVLCADGNSKRFYDFAGAMEQAKRHGWDSAPYGEPGETKGQRAARAVTADYEYLRCWCADLWWYVGVGVQVVDAYGNEVLHPYASTSGYLGGIDSDSAEYIGEAIKELADGVCRDIGKYGLVYRAAEWVDEESPAPELPAEVQLQNYRAALEDVAAILRNDPQWSMGTLAEVQRVLEVNGFDCSPAEEGDE